MMPDVNEPSTSNNFLNGMTFSQDQLASFAVAPQFNQETLNATNLSTMASTTAHPVSAESSVATTAPAAQSSSANPSVGMSNLNGAPAISSIVKQVSNESSFSSDDHGSDGNQFGAGTSNVHGNGQAAAVNINATFGNNSGTVNANTAVNNDDVSGVNNASIKESQDDQEPSKVIQINAPAHPVAEFLFQLTKMLTDNNVDYIEWSNAAIIVHDPPGLEKNILPKYFRHANYSSFQRQMNYFGFRKLAGKGKMSPCSYVNENATNDISSLLYIKRKKARNNSSAQKNLQRNQMNAAMSRVLAGQFGDQIGPIGQGSLLGATPGLSGIESLNGLGTLNNSSFSLNGLQGTSGLVGSGTGGLGVGLNGQQNILAQLQQAHASATNASFGATGAMGGFAPAPSVAGNLDMGLHATQTSIGGSGSYGTKLQGAIAGAAPPVAGNLDMGLHATQTSIGGSGSYGTKLQGAIAGAGPSVAGNLDMGLHATQPSIGGSGSYGTKLQGAIAGAPILTDDRGDIYTSLGSKPDLNLLGTKASVAGAPGSLYLGGGLPQGAGSMVGGTTSQSGSSSNLRALIDQQISLYSNPTQPSYDVGSLQTSLPMGQAPISGITGQQAYSNPPSFNNGAMPSNTLGLSYDLLQRNGMNNFSSVNQTHLNQYSINQANGIGANPLSLSGYGTTSFM